MESISPFIMEVRGFPKRKIYVTDSTVKQVVKQRAAEGHSVVAWTVNDGEIYVDSETGKSILAIDTQTLGKEGSSKATVGQTPKRIAYREYKKASAPC